MPCCLEEAEEGKGIGIACIDLFECKSSYIYIVVSMHSRLSLYVDCRFSSSCIVVDGKGFFHLGGNSISDNFVGSSNFWPVQGQYMSDCECRLVLKLSLR